MRNWRRGADTTHESANCNSAHNHNLFMEKIIVTSAWGAGYPNGGGVQWLNLHYLAGVRALGFEAFCLDILGPPNKGAEVYRDQMLDGVRTQADQFGFRDHCEHG